MSRKSLEVNRGAITTLMVLTVVGWQCKESDSLPEFVLHPDFEIELVASEPSIFDPVDLEFDHHGDAYVLQMPGYPKGEDQSSVVKLIDQDADGIFESSVVFATDLMQASSILPYRDGLLVAAPPDLLYLKDNDGDGRAEERTVIMSGYRNANLQHNFNGLTYGLDNWIYLANGGNGGSTYWSDVPDSIIQIGASDFRINADKHFFELVGRTSGGFELAMDDWGNIFGTHNMYHIRQNVFPSRYIGDLPINPRDLLIDISDHEEKGLGRIYPIGEQETRVNHPEQSGYFSGACGITYYGGDLFPSEFYGNTFVLDVVVNLLHRDIITTKGTVFNASRGRLGIDFLASSDRAFRPVNSTVGPDGALYILDMHRQVIEHPEWIPDELEVHMDLDAGKDKGRIYRIKPKNKQIVSRAISTASPKELVELLNHKNQWHRMTAQRLIVERKDAAVSEVLERVWSADSSPLNKLHILQCMSGLNNDISSILLSELKSSIHPQYGKQLLRLAEDYLESNDDLLKQIFALSETTDPVLSMQMLLTLSTVSKARQIKWENQYLVALSKAASIQGKDDQFLNTALSIAAKNFPIRFLRELKDEGRSPISADLLARIAAGVAHSSNSKWHLALLEEFTKGGNKDVDPVLCILDAYNRASLSVSGSEAKSTWSSALMKLEDSGNLDITAACWQLRKSLRIPLGKNTEQLILAASERLRKNPTLPPDEVISLAKILAHGDPRQVTDDLLRLVDARQPVAVQQNAINILDGLQDTAIVARLVDDWSGLSPATRRRVTDMLIYNEDNHALLFRSLENGHLNLSEFNFDLERRRRLLQSKNEQTASRAKNLFSDAGVIQRKEAIDKMRGAIAMQGNPNRGESVFEVQCATCHRFGTLGVLVGPDLSEISRKSKETLLHDILDPNAAADPEYINHIVETETGTVISGIIGNESDDAISIIMMGGEEKTVSKNQIKSLRSTGLSLMPEGMEGLISKDEMADLLAFLQRPVL